MEILYLWIEEYRNIKNQGFNFSSKWKFDYQNEQLTVEERPNAIDNFFGENIVNITALVGANGSGKTSVLEFLYENCFSNDNDLNELVNLLVHKQSDNVVKYQSNNRKGVNEPDNFFFFVVKNINQPFDFNIKGINHLTITKNTFKKHPTKNKPIIPSAFPIPSKGMINRLLNPVSLFSSSFLKRNKFSNQYYNISTSYSLDRSYNSTSYFSNEDRRFVGFLDHEKFIKKLPFVIDKTVSIYFTIDALGSNEKDHTKNRLQEFKKDYFLYDKIINERIGFFSALEGGTIEERLKYRLLKSLIISTQRTLANRVWVKNYPFFIINNSSIYEDLDKIHQKKHIPISEYIILLERYLKNIFAHQNIKSVLDFFYKFIDTNNLEHSFFIDTTTSKTRVFFEREDKLKEMLKNVLKVRFSCEEEEIKNMPFFRFLSINMEGMSSGERHILQLFARFSSLKDSLKNIPYLLILIDEGETSLHPQWQKQYIKLLTETLPLIFNKIPIQIILTSHSPFIVSDLPKENIIFLDTDEQNNTKVVDGLKQKETFGANIHTLFTDAFFMDGGLMGDFAKEKINAVITYLNEGASKENPVKTNDQAQQYINLIGEPIVKRQLQKMLDSLRVKKADKNEKSIDTMKQTLNALKEQVRLLENQINPSNNDSDKS